MKFNDEFSESPNHEDAYESELPAISWQGVETQEVCQPATKTGVEGRLILTPYQCQQILRMAQLGLNIREISTIMGVCANDKTLVARYGSLIEQGTSRGNYMLRRRQYDLAMAGDTKMLIHLGKCRLGQREEVTITTKQPLPWADDKPQDDML